MNFKPNFIFQYLFLFKGHELSEVDAFLQSQSNTAIPEVVVREDEIKESINSFQHYPRITAQSDILEFWDARRS